MNTQIPSDRQKFLSNEENKQKLIDMFSVLLVKDGIKVRHALANNDADTVIVQEALIRSKNCEAVVHFVNIGVFKALTVFK